jgi:hypothetical protein
MQVLFGLGPRLTCLAEFVGDADGLDLECDIGEFGYHH